VTSSLSSCFIRDRRAVTMSMLPERVLWKNLTFYSKFGLGPRQQMLQNMFCNMCEAGIEFLQNMFCDISQQ
jgi:hypothetical protein